MKPTMVVLRALGLGDFLTAVPALRALRRARPDHQLRLAAPLALGRLAELSGAVDALHPTPRLAEFRPLAEPVDVAVNLHGRGPQSHRALTAAEPRELLAFGCEQAGVAGPRWRPDEHEVHRWCRLVAEGWDAEADPGDLALRRPARASAAPGAVVVHPGAAYPARRWPVERFAAVARALADRGLQVVVTGSDQELPLARRLAVLGGLRPEAVLAGRTDLAGLAALVAEARLVVCGDTGIAHLATAYATPSVVLFGPVPPALWGPPATGPHVALWQGRGAGDPWADEVDHSLLLIEPDEVVEESLALLAAAAPGAERSA